MKKDVNYIVSGLERSGTSLMMQILEAGGLPVAYDDSRKADKNNPKGYYELENGKIIDKLRDEEFQIKKYKGKFIKITAYGLQFLPKGNYDIIYMIRNIGEIVESTTKMTENKSTCDKEELRMALVFFEKHMLDELKKKESKNFRFIPMFYNALMNESSKEAELGILKMRYPEFDVEKAKQVIDKKLYRNRSV
ncbi:MAG: nucleotide pyrophosphatase [Actinobacteria bacterium]|nr:nucleotide pyrophosphatase [Actinomycetota bacterium]MBE3114727.1 nucleotide pyrophosphatase [Actinomycetota bacterium]